MEEYHGAVEISFAGVARCVGLHAAPSSDFSSVPLPAAAYVHTRRIAADSEHHELNVAADIQTMLEETQLKFEEERQNLLRVLTNTSKEQCESSLNEEYNKFQETYDTFCKEKDAHMQTFRDLFSKVEVEKKKLLEKYEHHRKTETNTLSELDKTFSEKVTHAEQSVRKVKQDDKIFIFFRKSIGSSLECGSDDDFDHDE